MTLRKLIISTFMMFALIFPMSGVFAQTYNFNQNSGLNHTSNTAGFNSTDTSLERYITIIINIILSLLGVVFLGLMIYGGIVWMTAQGNEDKVKKAKELITEAVIGLIIVLAAYAITYFVLKLTSGSLV